MRTKIMLLTNLIALCVLAQPAAAQGPGNPFIVTIVSVPNNGFVNVRKQARSGSASVGKVKAGLQAFASGQCWNGNTKKLFSWQAKGLPKNKTNIWCSILVQDVGGTEESIDGWVLSKYLREG
jgi:hypothetical protein